MPWFHNTRLISWRRWLMPCDAVSVPTIRECLTDSRLPRLELRMLLEHVLQRSRVWLLAHDDQVLSALQYQQYGQLLQRRCLGEPMAYILGRREFLDFEVKVAPGVLIPRPETELLVQHALACIEHIPNPKVLDLGTGSGIVAIGLARARPDAQVWATDFSAVALQIARDNVQALGVQERVQCCLGSWYEAVQASDRFDLIVSNPPYIDARDEHLAQGDLRFEPLTALTDGHDGLEHIRQIVAGSCERLCCGGQVWLEHGYDQGAAVRQLFAAHGFVQIETLRDLAGQERVTGGVFADTVI